MSTFYRLSVRKASEMPRATKEISFVQEDWNSFRIEWVRDTKYISPQTILKRVNNYGVYSWEPIVKNLMWNVTTYTVTGITHNTLYIIRVCWDDINSGVFVPSESINYNTWAHAKPTSLVVNSYDSTSISIGWTNDNPHDEVITGVVIQKRVGVVYETLATYAYEDTPEYTFTGLTPNTSYVMRIYYTIEGYGDGQTVSKSQRTAVA